MITGEELAFVRLAMRKRMLPFTVLLLASGAVAAVLIG